VPYGIALAPAQILFSLSSGICLSFVGNACGESAQGLFAFGYSLAQLVTAIQAGFSTYWGPYVYAHYREEQERICRVHDVLNLLIFGFFCVLVMLEDIVFVIFPDKRGCLAIFPLLMLAVVFNILCEGTVYGNSIARKPWHDTIGIGLGALSNFGLCAVLVPRFGLVGAALALAASNGAAFLYRSVTGQMYYRTVASYPKTISGFLLAFAVTAVGTLLWQHFFIKFALVGVILFIYCTLYRAQLARLWTMGLGILRGIFHKR
jgi:O-antigen/teichoic acid export membrane protein